MSAGEWIPKRLAQVGMAKVVLIDDESRLLATLARFLERQGLEVAKGVSFADVQEHLHPGRFDVLVTDIVMPVFDGMKVLHEVLHERGCLEPVILITGEPNLETASQAVRDGAFDYIQKPVTKDRLLEVVNRGLRHVKLLRERDQARQREIQLLKNLAEIGESASVLTHEIRTPITGLRRALMAVGDKLELEEGVVIEEFTTNLTRIETLLGETLNFAKPLVVKPELASVGTLVEQALASCRPLDECAGMRFEVRVPGELQILADAAELVDVFRNLIRNACEACAGDGVMSIAAEQAEGRVRIDFTDSGPGIPVDARSEIFKPFFSSKQQGTGIGLAQSRKVVEAHGGSIALIASPAGACFRIEIPTTGGAADERSQSRSEG